MILVSFVLAVQLTAPAATLTVRDGSHSVSVPIVATSSGPLVQAGPVFSALGATYSRPARDRLTVQAGATHIELTLGLPFARIGTRAEPLSAAPVVRDSQVFVPLTLISEVLPRVSPEYRYDAAGAVVSRLSPRVARGSVQGTPPASPPAGAPGAAPVSTTPAARAKARSIVVVDAGHGGPDRGMSGPIGSRNKIFEADITLAVSKRLRDALQERGVDVVMTRTTDTLIALDDRGRIANKAGADLFLSIHVNAANLRWRNPRLARGFETFFLAEAKTEDEKRVADMENDAARFELDVVTEPGDPLSFLLSDMKQNEFLRESSTLAATIQHGLKPVHPGTDRGVKQAGFRVLIAAYMPAVLIELGFGTNATEARWLASAKGQQTLARAIADAAMRYLADYERRTNGVGSP